eukprot:7596819-Prorocentrum_lima.AAC.1
MSVGLSPVHSPDQEEVLSTGRDWRRVKESEKPSTFSDGTLRRYVGHMYETPSTTVPVGESLVSALGLLGPPHSSAPSSGQILEAKGIEIVRRDQCLLTQRLQ